MMLTAEECASELKVTARFVRNEIRDGRLLARRFRRNRRTVYRVDREAFDAYKDKYWPSDIPRGTSLGNE